MAKYHAILRNPQDCTYADCIFDAINEDHLHMLAESSHPDHEIVYYMAVANAKVVIAVHGGVAVVQEITGEVDVQIIDYSTNELISDDTASLDEDAVVHTCQCTNCALLAEQPLDQQLTDIIGGHSDRDDL